MQETFIIRYMCCHLMFLICLCWSSFVRKICIFWYVDAHKYKWCKPRRESIVFFFTYHYTLHTHTHTHTHTHMTAHFSHPSTVEHTYDACPDYSELGSFRIIAYLYVSDGSHRWQRQSTEKKSTAFLYIAKRNHTLCTLYINRRVYCVFYSM